MRRAGRESGGEPGLGPKGPKRGGAGVGRDGRARKRGLSDRQRQTTTAAGSDPQFQTCLDSDDNHLPFETLPRPPRTEATRSPVAPDVGCLTRHLGRSLPSIGYCTFSFWNLLAIGANVCHSNYLSHLIPGGRLCLRPKGHWLAKVSVREITAQCG